MHRKVLKGDNPTLPRLVISSFKQATFLLSLKEAIRTNRVDMEKVGVV
jgi:hypothetical protein